MSTFSTQTLEKIFPDHWSPGWGSIARAEVLFVQELIEEHQPVNFLEIGMASGLSGGLLASIIETTSFLLETHYSSKLSDVFKKCASKFNQLERLRTGV